MARHQDPTNAKKFINSTIRDLNCMITPGRSRLVKKREIVPTPRDLKAGLTVEFFRQFCAPGWLSVWREPAGAPKAPAAKAPAAKLPEQIPADVAAAIEAYGVEFGEDIKQLKASYFSEMPRMTVEKIESVAQERRDAAAAAEAGGDDEGGDKEADDATHAENEAVAAEAKFREDLKKWAADNGIPEAAEHIDTASMDTLRQVEGKSADEVMALLNPDDKEQDPSAGNEPDASDEGGDDAPEVPDTHILDPFHTGEGEAKQVHKKAFNQYIRKTYPDKDLNEAREAVGLPPAKES